MTLVLGALSSCNKWLDVQPKTELKQDELFSSEQGFTEALVGAYVSMTSPATYGRELTFGALSVMASDYSVNSSSEQAIQSLKPIEGFDYEKNQLKLIIDKIWLQQYNTIAQLNALLENIDGKKEVFTGNNYAMVKGEALALRAYIHFDLMRMFAPAYPQVDNQKYLPYVTIYGTSSSQMLPVNDFTEKLMKDINEAEQLLKDDRVNVFGQADRKIKMNILALRGLKARFYLYVGNTEEAFKSAQEVIDAKQIFLRPENADINLDRTIHSEHLFSLFSDQFEQRVFNLLTPEPGLFASVPYYFTEENKLTNTIFNNQSTDIRFKAPAMLSYQGHLTPHKFIYEDLPSTTLNAQKYYIPLMKLSEMYYIAAESASTPEEGLSFLNKVIVNRGLLPLSTAVDLQEELRKEYRKEFFSEGQFFYFYKRLGIKRIVDSPVIEMLKETYVFPLPEDEKIYGGR